VIELELIVLALYISLIWSQTVWSIVEFVPS
jgi:hypothetical protein